MQSHKIYGFRLHYIIGFFQGFLLGSFPTAYLLVKEKAQIDIRKSGSGNVGARNAFEVTGSKSIGIIVLAIDLLKGSCAVWISFILFGNIFWTAVVAGIGAVLGHNYSPWIKFKGGRGLATTAGVMIILGWIYILIWLILYFIAQRLFKQIHFSTVAASIAGPLFILLMPESLSNSILLTGVRLRDMFMASSVFSFIILIRHIEPIRVLLQSDRNES